MTNYAQAMIAYYIGSVGGAVILAEKSWFVPVYYVFALAWASVCYFWFKWRESADEKKPK